MDLRKTKYFLFYLAWLVLMVLQARYTELIDDEAYYRYYAQYLAWGYYDHPPVVAVLIKAGTYLLGNTPLGVRTGSVILGLITIYLWEKIIRPSHRWLYYLLVSSVAVLHFFGFLATPDMPMLFFTSLAFFFYRQFMHRPDRTNAILLGIALGISFITKYHAMVIAALVLLSYPKWFKNKYFWLSVSVIVLIDLPHLLWQIQHHFPSLQYHLFTRSASSYRLAYTLEYLIWLPLIFGPFTGWFMLLANLRQKAKDPFEKALKYTYWGGLLFFLAMTFKGRNEPHWILFTLFPGLYFTYKYLEQKPRIRKLFYLSLVPAYLFIFWARIFMIAEYHGNQPVLKQLSERFHNKKWITGLHNRLGDMPVLFVNSYQKASLYHFYTGVPSFGMNNIYYGRQNQFDIWHWEDSLRGQRVAVVPIDGIRGDSAAGWQYVVVDNFRLFSKLGLRPAKPLKKSYRAGETVPVILEVVNPYSGKIDPQANKKLKTYISYHFEQDGKITEVCRTPVALTTVDPGSKFLIRVKMPPKPGKYHLYFDVKTRWFQPNYASGKRDIIVEP